MGTADRDIGWPFSGRGHRRAHHGLLQGNYRSAAGVSKINKIVLPFVGEEETLGGEPAVAGFVFASMNAPGADGALPSSGPDYAQGIASASQLAWTSPKPPRERSTRSWARLTRLAASPSRERRRDLAGRDPRSQAFLREKAEDNALAVEVAYDVLEELISGRRSKSRDGPILSSRLRRPELRFYCLD